jgi:hypothetical protein
VPGFAVPIKLSVLRPPLGREQQLHPVRYGPDWKLEPADLWDDVGNDEIDFCGKISDPAASAVPLRHNAVEIP